MAITEKKLKFIVNTVKHIDCSDLDSDQRGTHFVHTALKNHESCDFSGAVLYKCYPASVENAINCNPLASATDVYLSDNDLTESYLVGIRLYQKEFKDLDLQGVDFAGAYLSEVSFVRCNLKNVSFDKATLHTCVFDGCIMGSTTFIGSRLAHSTVFENMSLSKVYFDKATFDSYSTCHLSVFFTKTCSIDLDTVSFKDAIFDGRVRFAFAKSEADYMDKLITEYDVNVDECAKCGLYQSLTDRVFAYNYDLAEHLCESCIDTCGDCGKVIFEGDYLDFMARCVDCTQECEDCGETVEAGRYCASCEAEYEEDDEWY
jgi:uncharacterized protein YjbI with pentapeptide repeats